MGRILPKIEAAIASARDGVETSAYPGIPASGRAFMYWTLMRALYEDPDRRAEAHSVGADLVVLLADDEAEIADVREWLAEHPP